MKKLFSLFAAVLFAGSMMAQTPRVTLDFTDSGWGFPTEYVADATNYTNGGYQITVNASNGHKVIMDGSNVKALLFGKNGATITLPAMTFNVAKIVVKGVTGASGKVTFNVFVNGDAVSTQATSSLVDHDFAIAADNQAAGTVYVIKVTNANNCQVSAVEFYEAVAGAPEDPTFSVAEGAYLEAQSVELACTTEGATIHYTLDGTVPDETSAVYSAALAINATTTVKAIAIKAGVSSGVVSATYTILTGLDGAGTQENPFTVADLAIINNKLAGEHWVMGYIVGCAANEGAIADDVVNSNIAIGDNAEQTTNLAPVQLPSGDIRNALNLVDNPTNVGKQVKIKGNLQSYFLVPGVKNLSAYELIEPAPDTRMAGAYNVGGANADYASLFAACQDVNAKGIKADVELLICANLTEGQNPVLSNPTNYSITIRPNADEDRKIEFTATKDNFGPSGAFCIGSIREVKSGVDTIAWGTALTNNIIIDGYAEGGETRRLTFDTPQGFGSGAGPILFYGDVHNCKLINCIIYNSRNAGTTGVTVRTANMAKFDAGTPNYRPENILIENNIIAPRVNGQGIVINGSQASTIGDGAPLGTIIRNNQITASNRGVFFNGVNGLVFEGNELTMNGAAGFNAHGLFGYTQVVGDIIVKDNVFKVNTLQVAAGDFGVIAIGSSGAITGREDDVHWIIDNNYFYGMDALAEATGKFKLMYVRAGSNTTLRHNTFYIPTFTNAVPMDLVAANCAAALYLAGAGAYAAENNIFVCKETASNVSLIRGALNDNIKNNVYHHDGGNAAILAGAVVAADSAAFFAEGANAGSVWKEPVFADAANGDLSITTADADLLMPRLEDILVDITGADRRENTYAGAFEGPEPSPATAIDAIKVEGIQKIFRNGEVLIIRDGKTYNMMGQIVE